MEKSLLAKDKRPTGGEPSIEGLSSRDGAPDARNGVLQSAPSAGEASDQGDDEDDQENEEQDLRNARRCYRHAAEAEDGGNDGYDQKHQSPVEHGLRTPKSACVRQQAELFDRSNERLCVILDTGDGADSSLIRGTETALASLVGSSG